MRLGRGGAQGRPMNNLIGALQSCSCSPWITHYLVTFGVAHTSAACSRLTAFSVPSFWSLQLLVINTYISALKMVSQGSLINTSIGNPVVSPTSRLVAGTSVLATFIPSSITPSTLITAM